VRNEKAAVPAEPEPPAHRRQLRFAPLQGRGIPNQLQPPGEQQTLASRVRQEFRRAPWRRDAQRSPPLWFSNRSGGIVARRSNTIAGIGGITAGLEVTSQLKSHHRIPRLGKKIRKLTGRVFAGTSPPDARGNLLPIGHNVKWILTAKRMRCQRRSGGRTRLAGARQGRLLIDVRRWVEVCFGWSAWEAL